MANNRGGVRKLKSGRWQARYTDPFTGERQNAPVTFTRKTEALDFLAKVKTDAGKGIVHDYSGGKIRLAAWCDRWIEGRPNIRPRTQESLDSAIRVHIKPFLGNLPLNSIQSATVRDWYRDRLATGRPTAAAHAYRTLSSIMKGAVADGLIVTNPCTMPGAGKATSHAEINPLNPEQLRALIDAIEPRYSAMVAVAGAGGLRWGELLGLRTDDYASETRKLRIDRQMIEVNGRFEVGPPKTAKGRREITLPQNVGGLLDDHIAEYAVPGGHIFLTSRGTHPRRSNFRRKFWLPATTAVGVPDARFHDLRHTAASLLIDAGMNPLVIQQRLGHSDIRTTLGVYGHLMKNADDLAADAINDLF